MSYARGCGQNGGHFYSNITQPVKIDCNFVIDSANGNGLGIRSLKSNGYIQNVFMNTSASFTGTTHTSTSVTAIAGGTASLQVGNPVQGSGIAAGTTIASIVSSSAITLSAATSSSVVGGTITYQGVGNGLKANPNPLAGYALIQFKNNFKYYLGGFSGFVSTVQTSTKIDNSALTIGQVYVITTLGNSSLADWQSIGFYPGFTPAVGAAFVATAVGVPGEANTSTSRVMIPKQSGITAVEVIGDPNQTISNSSIASNGGALVLVQFLAPSFTGSALGTHTHDFTVIGGQAASTTNDIANYAGPLLGKQEAANATYLGANSATNGGVVAASAGTPAGSMSMVASAPQNGCVAGMSFYFDISSVTIDGL